MATQLQAIQNLVSISIGGRQDSVASNIIIAAINYACTLAALIFRPPELRAIENLSFPSGAASMSIAQINWLDIQLVMNVTDGIVMRFVSYEKMDTIIPASLVDTKYYSLFGDNLFLRASPASAKALTLSCLLFPPTLVNPTDLIPFSGYDSYIVTWASMLVQASLEEIESAAMWTKLVDTIVQPLVLGTRERDILQGQQAYFDAMIQQAQQPPTPGGQ
jgi:hypothetical protein